ncbi:MAG TPA: M20/M25/M40 family metallo-hydrolase [Allosphingosinicella sp.]|jgi:Zn-dependent M28 family amino/carboxypeptidase|nr:M20/M25/M40 family metallo-hydrolase [Allosphingosinicella sp.]
MVSRALAALALFLLPLPASAEPVAPDALRRHIDVLASDDFAGREPGTEGEQKTIAYIAGQMRGFGLEPAGPDNSWYQPVEVRKRRPGDQSSLWQATAGKSERIELGRDEIILIGRSARETLRRAPVVFAGHGAVIPGKGVDQLAGADLKGAVVLILYDAPDETGFPSYSERVAAVAAAGAAAVIGIIGRELPWPVVQRVYDSGQTRLAVHDPAPIAGAISQPVAESLLRAAGADLAGLLAVPGPSFAPVPLKLRASFDVATSIDTILTHNVVGRVRGSAGGRESLLYLAHWDHLGLCEREGPDRICNGAVDNASGVAALLEIARALGRGKRPRRDILFLATTAEEMGLLGAEYFTARPTVPLGSIVAAINMDTLAIAPRGEKVAVMGRGHPALDSLIDRTVAEAGRALDGDDEAAAFVERQDGWAFTRAGIPSIMVNGSFADMKKLGAFLAGPYHSAADNPGPGLVLDGAAEDTDLMIALGRKLADPALYPWPSR